MATALLAVVAGGAVLAAIALDRIRRHQVRVIARASVRTRMGRALAESLIEGNTLDEILRLLIPSHADWAILHLVEEGHVRRAAVVHADAAFEQRMRTSLTRMPFVSDAPAGPARVIQTGKAYLIREVTPAVLEKQPDPAMLQEVGLGSFISVPLRVRGQIIGVLTLARRAEHAYDEEDLAFAEDVAYRLAIAVENRRLFLEAKERFEQTVSANFVTGADGRILACNETFATLLGFESIDQAVQTPVADLYLNALDRPRFLAELRAKHRVAGHELLLKRRDGQVVTVSADAVAHFDERGELVRVSGFLADRTLQKSLEDQLQQAQRLEAVGQLAGGIAHDFNNLLTIIIGCADLLRAGVGRDGSDHDPLEELSKAATRAASLTRQLLAFSRRQVLQPKLVQLNDALRQVHSMLRRLTPPRIVLVLNLAPELEPIQVDPGQLDQVIVNLVVNSVDAIPESGTITLSTSMAELTEEDVKRHPYVTPGRYVALAVNDTGVGMDEATVARVFEPFFTTKPVGKGTGLGMSTVYGIVKQSGGYVWVTSELNRGTVVRICLPSAVAAAVPA